MHYQTQLCPSQLKRYLKIRRSVEEPAWLWSRTAALRYWIGQGYGLRQHLQTCQVLRIRRETHAFEVYLTLSSLRKLRLKSHAFVSTAINIFPVMLLWFFIITTLEASLLLQTKAIKNCDHQMRFLSSNATKMRWRPGLCPEPNCRAYNTTQHNKVNRRRPNWPLCPSNQTRKSRYR